MVAIVGVAALAVSVWGLAHLASAPGTTVKVLWGLVEYTKMPALPPPSSVAFAPATPESSPRGILPEEPTVPQHTLGPIALSISHEISPSRFAEVQSDLRKQHDLRELRPIETDRPINTSPPHTFFFVFAPALQTVMDGRPDFPIARIYRFQEDPSTHFEVQHRRAGELLLLAYAPESDADRIRMLNGEDEFHLTIAPRPWDTFTALVELPMDRIVSAKARMLQIEEYGDLSILDVVIR